MFLTVGGILPRRQCAELDEPVAEICRFDETAKCFKQYRSLHEIYKELGDKMGYSICTYGKVIIQSMGDDPNNVDFCCSFCTAQSNAYEIKGT